MKGIGTFVLLLLVGIGVVGYVVTRPPDTDLDATERVWVDRFQSWRDATAHRVDRAYVQMNFSSDARNARLIAPLRACSTSLEAIGAPPSLMTSAHEAALTACGRAEHAYRVNERFGVDSLATTKLHLGEAGDRLRLSAQSMRRALDGDT